MYWASKSLWSRGRISHLRWAEISFVSSLWSKSRASFWKYRPSRPHGVPGRQLFTKGRPGTAEPVSIASCGLAELLPLQLPCVCVSSPDCSMPFEPNTSGDEPARFEEFRGSKAGGPEHEPSS